MKKILNVFGVLGSIFLTFILTVILSCFVLVVNIRGMVSEKGISNTLSRIDIVDILKVSDDGNTWEDLKEMSVQLNLTEEELENILNSDAIKSEFGEILSGMVSSITGDEVYNISKDEFIELIDTVIDEYNKVADVKISVKDRDELVNSITDEFIAELNSSMSEMNLESNASESDKEVIQVIDYVLFGGFVSVLIVIIVILIALIALFRFSYYKWMSYVGVASLLTSMLPLALGVVLNIVPMNSSNGLDILVPFKDVLASNFFITAGILFGIYVVMFILNAVFKKIEFRRSLKNTQELENREYVVTEEVKNEEEIVEQ